MRKILSLFIEAIFWIHFFITPLGIGGLIAMFIYIQNSQLQWLSIIITIVSGILGVIYAEWVRRNHGLSKYASKIIATPDIWPDEYVAKEDTPKEKEFETSTPPEINNKA